jgi:uncharacterized protein involved in response to NO
MTALSGYRGPAFFSYGFRPFFFSAAVFAGVAVPIWVLIVTGIEQPVFLYGPRAWHVHEMVFGFLFGVVTGFLLTAMPNWTDRPPIRGLMLVGLWMLWLAGRLVMAVPFLSPMGAALVDGAFPVVMAALVWREVIAGQAWDRLPIGVLISLYALANILFHLWAVSDAGTGFAERLALIVIMLLLALIGGRITPAFTEDFLVQHGIKRQPVPFSGIDGLSIGSVALAGLAWMVFPLALGTGWLLFIAGLLNVFRLSRWYGEITWKEPLVLMLHVGYGWLAVSLLVLGAAILGTGPHIEDAVHALTTGAVGAMTLAVMTRATLGHTGRVKHAGPLTMAIYLLVNLGALIRVAGSALTLPPPVMFTLAAGCWSGAYVLFAAGYAPALFGPDRDEAP